MTELTFVQPDGTVRTVTARAGESVMQAAVSAGIAGIVAECGGSAACATCHVVLDRAVYDALPAAEAHEDDMLDFADAPRAPTSRLSCQLTVGPALEGAVLRVPAA